jgi:hypothetical protein
MKIFFLTLAICFFDFNTEDDQTGDGIEFSQKRLEDIASQLPPEFIFERDTIILCPEVCLSKSLVIQYNDKHQVSHLGISLFSKETKEIINQPVCDFIERLFLELSLEKDNKLIVDMLDRNKIIFRRNGLNFGEGNVNSINKILQEIEEPAQFMLKKNEDSYSVIWEYGFEDMLVISFPLNRELILGTNKKESDNILYDQLQQENKCNGTSDIKMFLSAGETLTSTENETVFINKGNTFMIKGVNEDTYYKKSDKGYELIFDKKYPKESFTNLILGHNANNSLKIHVKHSMYGNFSPEYEMKFSDFICFFRDDFNIFSASYQKGQDELKSTIIFQNKQYNYIHLLTINTSEECIFEENGVMSASFYSNIPQHNIKNIVGDLMKND